MATARKTSTKHSRIAIIDPAKTRRWFDFSFLLLSLVVLLNLRARSSAVKSEDFKSNTLFGVELSRRNQPEVAYYWNAAEVLIEVDENISDVGSARVFFKLENITYARQVILHGGDTRLDRTLTDDSWLLTRTRPLRWYKCSGGPESIGGTLHSFYQNVNGSTPVILIHRALRGAWTRANIWIFHDCQWFDRGSYYPSLFNHSLFPATFDYNSLGIVAFFGGCRSRIFDSETSLQDKCLKFNTDNVLTLVNLRAVIADWLDLSRPKELSGEIFKFVPISNSVDGYAPTGRRTSGSTYHLNSFWLFGGEDENNHAYCDLWRVDLGSWESASWDNIHTTSLKWELIKICDENTHTNFNYIGSVVLFGRNDYLYALGTSKDSSSNGPLMGIAWSIPNHEFIMVASNKIQRPNWPTEFTHFNVPRGAFASMVTERATGMLFGDFSILRTGAHQSSWEFTTFLNEGQPDIVFVSVPNINRPTPKAGHTFNLLPEKVSLSTVGDGFCRVREAILFGGTDGRTTNEVWRLQNDCDSTLWTYLSSENEAPEPRCFHYSALVGVNLIVFGGTDAIIQQTFTDFWYLHINHDKVSWTKLSLMTDSDTWNGVAGAAYTCRDVSSPINPPGDMYDEVRCVSFGGLRNGEVVDDLIIFQIFFLRDDSDALPLVRILNSVEYTSDQKPPARAHGIILRDAGQSRFVIFGGRNTSGSVARQTIAKDIWMVDVHISENNTRDRRNLIVNATNMSFVGYIDPNDNNVHTDSLAFYEYEILCPIRSHRQNQTETCGHSTFFTQLTCYMRMNENDTKWLIYGGVGENISQDVWEFDFTLKRFTLLDVNTGAGVNPNDEAARWGHACFFFNDFMITFGGAGRSHSYLSPVVGMRPTCNDGWHTENMFSSASCKSCRGEFFFQAGECVRCPLDTENHEEKLLSGACTTCSERAISRCHGSCRVDKGQPTCSCSALKFGERCQYPILVAVIFPFLAIVGILQLILLLFRRQRRAAAANEVLEALLDGVNEELATLERVFEIDKSELVFIKRIDTATPGASGDVYKAKYNGKTVAVKQLKSVLIEGDESNSFREFQEEILFLRGIRHANIVFFYGAGVDSFGVPFLVTEFCERGSLSAILRDNSIALSRIQRLRFLQDAARGMSFLHHLSPPRVHGDLKSANLLVTADWTVQIGDFGTSCLCDCLGERAGNETYGSVRARSSSTTLSGQQWKANLAALGTTPRWAAPEVLESNTFVLRSDVYSFGMVVFEVLTRTIPFAEIRFNNAVEKKVLAGGRPEIPDHADIFLTKLMRDCWQQHHAARPTFQTIFRQLRNELGDLADSDVERICQDESRL